MTTPNNNFQGQGKDSNHSVQKRIFAAYLRRKTATCTMVAEDTGIRQKCLTRYKREMQRMGLLEVVFTAPCKYTGRVAQYLTTNPALIQSLKGGKR